MYTIEAFAGEVSGLEVSYSSTGANPPQQFDEWRASMRAGDAQGRLLLSRNARPMENRLEVRGTGGRIEIDRFMPVCRVQRTFPGQNYVGVPRHPNTNADRELVR